MTCPRIICETWTPGRAMSPDGPAREMHTPCTLDAGHDGDHAWGEAVAR